MQRGFLIATYYAKVNTTCNNSVFLGLSVWKFQWVKFLMNGGL